MTQRESRPRVEAGAATEQVGETRSSVPRRSVSGTVEIHVKPRLMQNGFGVIFDQGLEVVGGPVVAGLKVLVSLGSIDYVDFATMAELRARTLGAAHIHVKGDNGHGVSQVMAALEVEP